MTAIFSWGAPIRAIRLAIGSEYLRVTGDK